MFRNTELTKEEKDIIKNLHDNKLTYKEIKQRTGYSYQTICKVVRGRRSRSESCKTSWNLGRHVITDEIREILSDNGKRACRASQKYWTKPEIEFKYLINGIQIGVKFPEYIKEIKGVSDDRFEKFLCYQYPIQRYVLDFVDEERKIAININGDYWHANPILYQPEKLGKLQKLNVRQDENKRKFLIKHGWKVVDIWESEIYWNKKIVIEKLRAVGIAETHVFYTDKSKVQLFHCPPKDWSEELKNLWFKKSKTGRIKNKKVNKKNCVFCNKEFEYTGKRKRSFCSPECYSKKIRKVDRPTKEELQSLINQNSILSLGRKFKVSDNSVRKWMKLYGISKSTKR